MNPLIRFDRRVTFWLQSWPSVLHPYMLAITLLGSLGCVVLVSLVIAVVAYSKHYLRLSLAFVAILPSEALNALLKVLFNRMRPHTQFAQNMLIHTKSFPSGHAFGSFVLYGLLAYLCFTRLPHNWQWVATITLASLIVLIGISRVYLGAHYFFDVIGGWVLGAVILTIIIRVAKI